jgi:hypothetical protein
MRGIDSQCKHTAYCSSSVLLRSVGVDFCSRQPHRRVIVVVEKMLACSNTFPLEPYRYPLCTQLEKQPAIQRGQSGSAVSGEQLSADACMTGVLRRLMTSFCSGTAQVHVYCNSGETASQLRESYVQGTIKVVVVGVRRCRMKSLTDPDAWSDLIDQGRLTKPAIAISNSFSCGLHLVQVMTDNHHGRGGTEYSQYQHLFYCRKYIIGKKYDCLWYPHCRDDGASSIEVYLE